ncbi:oxidoreductase [Devosia sp.]|uniref:oxidoreductase n=1 Tax=Devosia sp. TaxID=1871048 RepID=UPI0035B47049
MRSSLKALVAVILATPLFATVAVQAGELAPPQGEVVLTVTGSIDTSNAAEGAVFDLAMLEALGMHTTVTVTPWYDGARTFSGPLGADLLKAVGAVGSTLKVTALNDYVTEIPVEDFQRYPVILATRLDGAEMSVRDKGPIFVIYPFDDAPELNNETYYGRSAWQVKSIEVK